MIVLFPADCNYAFKHAGRKMMQYADQAKALAPEQYGSRKRHKAMDLALNKALMYAILCQLKRPGAVCSNNAKSCCDLIGHTQASLVMQQMGVLKAMVDCIFTMLQEAIHQVCTGYGDSSLSYVKQRWLTPLHGIGQGNGAGPLIWARFWTFFCNPLIKCVFFCFAGFAVIDDTDLLQTLHHNSTAQQVTNKLQRSLDIWEGVLSAPSGVIVPEKSFWYQIDFAWNGGNWRYKLIAESPGSLSVRDISGFSGTLTRLEPFQSAKTLGIFLTPDGNMEQFKKLRRLAIEWVEKMKLGNQSKNELWVALYFTLWRRLTYCLCVVRLSKAQWVSIMSYTVTCAASPRHLPQLPQVSSLCPLLLRWVGH
jgi:hypothetical protein